MAPNFPRNKSSRPPRPRRTFQLIAIRLDDNIRGDVQCQLQSENTARLKFGSRQEAPLHPIRLSDDDSLSVTVRRRRRWWNRAKKFEITKGLDTVDSRVPDEAKIMLVLKYASPSCLNIEEIVHGTMQVHFQEVPTIDGPSIQVSAVSVDVRQLVRPVYGGYLLSLAAGGNIYFKRKISDVENRYALNPPFVLHPNGSLRIRIQFRRHWWTWRKTKIESALSYERALASTSDVILQKFPEIIVHLFQEKESAVHVLQEKLAANRPPPEHVLPGGMSEHLDAARILVQRQNRTIDLLGDSTDFFDRLLSYIGAASELHPIAKAVFSAFKQLYEDLKKPKEYDVLVLNFLDDLAAAYRHVSFDNWEELDDSVRIIRRLAGDTLNLICKYYDHGSLSLGTKRGKIEEEFGDLKKRLERFNYEFANQVRVQTAQDVRSLLDKFMEREFKQALSVLQLKSRRLKPIGGCNAGTREEIFSKIDAWLESSSMPNILWIEGHPGAGKTSIAATLVERLKKSAKNTRLASSFFFERDNVDFTAPSVFWSKVSYDLAQLDPRFASGVVATLKRGDIDFSTTPLDAQFNALVADHLKAIAEPVARRPRFVVIVDAADECGGLGGSYLQDCRNLLSTLTRWSELNVPQFKLVVTSRGEAVISRVLSRIASRIEIDLSASSAKKDIRRYLKTEITRIVDDYIEEEPDEAETLHAWPDSALLSQLVRMAGGLIVWAKTLVTFMEDGNPRDRLESMLAGENMGEIGDIDVLYRKILEISFRDRRETTLRLFHAVVGTIVVAKRPLDSIEAIECQMELAGINRRSQWRDVRRRLQSVIEKDTLRFQHRTFVDFLVTSKACPSEFRIDVSARKKILTLSSLKIMQGLSFNMCRLKTSYVFNSNLSLEDLHGRLDMHLPSAVQFCCYYWADHLDGNHGHSDLLFELHNFMEHGFLFWVEALSLLHSSAEPHHQPSMDCALEQLQAVLKWSTSQPPATSLAKLAEDSIQFLTDFKVPILQSTPHIYLSALPWTSPSSEVWRNYKSLFQNTASIRVEEGPTRRMERISAVSFSPKGYLASASGSERAVIKFWDADTGAPRLQALLGHQGTINAISFSSDGDILASGSDDNTVRVWNVEDGQAKAVLAGHTGAVTAVSFPPMQSQRVLSTSVDGTLRTWEVASGKEVDSINTNQGPIACATFFDNSKFVTGANGSTMPLLWGSGRKSLLLNLRPVREDSGSITCMAGSGGKTVMGTSSGTMKFNGKQWNAHSDKVTSVALHGTRIASASRDRTVKIWDADSLNLILGPFEDHRRSVNAVAFSADGRRLVSGSSDGTLRIWDVGEVAEDPRRPGGAVRWRLDRRDGWIRGDDPGRGDHLLMWVPPVYRENLCWGRCVAVIGARGVKAHLDYVEAAYGSIWAASYTGRHKS